MTSNDQQDRWAKNRAAVEARYQEHLRLGPEQCPCNVCRRDREAAR